MSNKSCLVGQIYDNLLRMCYSATEPSREVHLKTEPVPMTQNQLLAKTMTTKVLVLSSALWVCLILAITVSILYVVLLCVIFRRQTRNSSNSEEAVPELKPLQKTESPVQFHPPPSERNGQAETFQRAADLPSTCNQLHLGAQIGSKWEDRFAGCRGPTRCGGKEGGGGLPACSTVVDHRIPLPATELGGTVLVTTKTV